MTDRPKFEDWWSGSDVPNVDQVRHSDKSWLEVGWKACMSACNPIIAGLEKQLDEARAEVAGAFVAASKHRLVRDGDNEISGCCCGMRFRGIIGWEKHIEGLTPEHAHKAMEQRIAEKDAEIAGAYLAVAKAIRCKCAPNCKMINPVIGPDTILALTPEHARQALEQRIAGREK